jgi:hypothetical protein
MTTKQQYNKSNNKTLSPLSFSNKSLIDKKTLIMRKPAKQSKNYNNKDKHPYKRNK